MTRDPGSFDELYKDARDRLLLQTYALTGDRALARRSVRDAFVVAWHHWPKMHVPGSPARSEAAVRRVAWARAQRRHGARPWHRDKDVEPALRATLDALASLPASQRRVLVLAHLAIVDMPGLAAELDLTQSEAEHELQAATTAFSLQREVHASAVTAALEPLTAILDDTPWPRSTILCRAGAGRRRTHTALGVLGGVAALVLSGVVVSDVSGASPQLDRPLTGLLGTSGTAPTPDASPAVPAEEPTEVLPATSLLAPAQVAQPLPGRGWRERATSDNSEGNGLVLPCQRERYADPTGQAALVRTFAAAGTGKPTTSAGKTEDPPRTVRPRAVQMSEASSTPRAARRAYRSLVSWVGSCAQPRTQLIAARTIDGVGDATTQLVLRDWAAPVRTTVVQVSRSGVFTTAFASTVGGEDPAPAAALATLQARAVDALCELPGAGACANRPRLSPATPPPTGEVPAMIAEIDLPPVVDVGRPWVGTSPRKALSNAASTGCDKASFTGRYDGTAWRQNLTRTFLVPQARLPAQFGVTETVGSLPVESATAFVEQVRARIAACPDRDLGTKVRQLASSADGDSELTAWELTTEVSDQRSIRFFMAVLRRGTSVAQVGYVPAGDVRLRDGEFAALAERALDRLGELRQLREPKARSGSKPRKSGRRARG